jgi:signal transduction histidine kinase
VVSAIEVWRFRRWGMASWALSFNIGVGFCGHVAIVAATGGLESPAIFLMPLLALFAGVWVERHWVRLVMVSVQLAAIWTFALLAVDGAIGDFNLQLFGGGARAGHGDALLIFSAAFLSVAICLAAILGKVLRSVFSGMVWKAFEAREESLQSHAERTRELTALSGEIAHELKNPMSSAKGLSALLARDITDGKAGERLGVLRREIDRMQQILDEFLNFSRPLVPLSVESTDLGALAADVAELHEGLARERKVGIDVRGQASASCDPRKVRQVLLNLVQNALDVSPAGSQLEIELLERDGKALVRVLDAGPGLDASVAGRLFEPGITTKPHGSGLGLVIARALARQHGGDLVLANREGGGCAAELSLPIEPEPQPASAQGASA